jgi:universal stress protein A
MHNPFLDATISRGALRRLNPTHTDSPTSFQKRITMKMNLILCPVDFSNCSQLAVELAGKLCRSVDTPKPAKVVLLHITEPGKEAPSMIEYVTDAAQQRLRDDGHFDSKTKIEYLTLKGKPSSVIVDYAKKKKVDLIVMGTRGQSAFKKLMVGSVAESVMQDAPCPVIAINPPKK